MMLCKLLDFMACNVNKMHECKNKYKRKGGFFEQSRLQIAYRLR